MSLPTPAAPAPAGHAPPPPRAVTRPLPPAASAPPGVRLPGTGGPSAPCRRGRARKARVLVPDPAGPAPATRRAAVVGGGIAGLAAATALAERGVRVTLLEREELTSAAGSPDGPTPLADGSAATMSRGFHAFFRQYYNLRGLLRRTDPGLACSPRCPTTRCGTAAGLRGQFRPRAAHPAVERARLRRAAARRSAGGTWPRMDPAAALPLLDVRVPEVYERLRRRQRRGLPGRGPLPGGGPAPGVRGVLPQLLRRPARTVRGRAGC